MMINTVVVVSSGYNEGGTWAGAADDLRHGWAPMFVILHSKEATKSNAGKEKKEYHQQTLFDMFH